MSESWIQTYGGGKFFYDSICPNCIDIASVAHALSNLCRFTGHVTQYYSIAEHSVRVMWLLQKTHQPVEVQFAGLMHDAPEAYTNDLNRPLKKLLPEYQAKEHEIWDAFVTRYNINNSPEVKALVKSADNVMLKVEALSLIPGIKPEEWGEWFMGVEIPNGYRIIQPWSPTEAKEAFLREFRRLTSA